MSTQSAQYFVPAVNTNEQLVITGPVVLYGIYPTPNTTAGAVTIRDGAAADASGDTVQVCALGLPAAGKTFGPKGILLKKGLTIQHGTGADTCLVVYEARG